MPAPDARRRRLLLIGGGLLGLLGCCALAPVLFLDSLVTFLAERNLAARGMECEDLSVDAQLDMEKATVAPTVCRFAEGSIEEMRFPEPVVVELESLEAKTVRTPEVQVVLRPDDSTPDVSHGFEEAVLAALSIDRIVCELLTDASRLSTEEWPAFEVPRFEISRGGERVALLEQTRIRSEVGVVELTVDRVTFGATGSAVVNGVGVRLTPVGGEARGRITVEVNLLITRVNREFAVRATVRGLDTDRPACEMAID